MAVARGFIGIFVSLALRWALAVLAFVFALMAFAGGYLHLGYWIDSLLY